MTVGWHAGVNFSVATLLISMPIELLNECDRVIYEKKRPPYLDRYMGNRSLGVDAIAYHICTKEAVKENVLIIREFAGLAKICKLQICNVHFFTLL